MVDSVVFFLADKAEYKGIDPQEMKELADEFNKQIVAAFKDKWPIVTEPAPMWRGSELPSRISNRADPV